MRTNPTSPPRNPIPHSIPLDGLAIRFATDAEAFAWANLSHDAVASPGTRAAVDVGGDGGVEGAPFICADVEFRDGCCIRVGVGIGDGVGEGEKGEEGCNTEEGNGELHCLDRKLDAGNAEPQGNWKV